MENSLRAHGSATKESESKLFELGGFIHINYHQLMKRYIFIVSVYLTWQFTSWLVAKVEDAINTTHSAHHSIL
jgi:hypothetical protein